MTTKYRNFCITLNNWTQGELADLLSYNFQFLILAEEVGPECGTPHLQGYAELDKQMRLSGIKKIPGLARAHIEPRRGTQEEAITYCKKPDTPEDKIHIKGEPKKDGVRKDLLQAKEEINQGKTVDELTIEDPMLYHMYGRTLNKLEEIAFRKKFRTWTTEGEWYWGKTGVGKSHRAFEGYNPETHYVLNVNDNGWWDGYTGQEIVIINEFRGQIPYGELLDLTDKWPKTVKQRNKAPVPFLAKKIIITSCSPPENIYGNVFDDQERVDQLLRRFKVELLSQAGRG